MRENELKITRVLRRLGAGAASSDKDPSSGELPATRNLVIINKATSHPKGGGKRKRKKRRGNGRRTLQKK